jgi:phosphoserine phosphatase RsbU/P
MPSANTLLVAIQIGFGASPGVFPAELWKIWDPEDPGEGEVYLPWPSHSRDGYEVCGVLKATPESRDIPVIFLIGKTDTEDETKGFKVGAVDYIHKPFSPAVLKARVHTHLVLREAREQLARQLLDTNNELEMAREIQLSIVPHEIPKISGLEIAVRYSPMSSVAGDFYDFIIVDEKRVGILIADVSGHGLPAALIASMLKVALAAQFPHAFDPGRILTGLNQSPNPARLMGQMFSSEGL